jgi:hypothetical protein
MSFFPAFIIRYGPRIPVQAAHTSVNPLFQC